MPQDERFCPWTELVFDHAEVHRGEARLAVSDSRSYTEALRRLGMRPAGGNHALFRKYVDQIWRISTAHFDPHATIRALAPQPRDLKEVLVEHSTYSRGTLKRRLLKEGLKQPVCEMCGQDEKWRGRRMALILDHINGVPDDNRLENLRIICANCAASLDTHCGRKSRLVDGTCALCGEKFLPSRPGQRYCSRGCGSRAPHTRGIPKPELRRVDRPPYWQLLEEIEDLGYREVGRKYGVSDNAIRKWERQYEREMDLRGLLRDLSLSARANEQQKMRGRPQRMPSATGPLPFRR